MLGLFPAISSRNTVLKLPHPCVPARTSSPLCRIALFSPPQGNGIKKIVPVHAGMVPSLSVPPAFQGRHCHFVHVSLFAPSTAEH